MRLHVHLHMNLQSPSCRKTKRKRTQAEAKIASNGPKRRQKSIQIAFAFEFALAFALNFIFARSDPIWDGSMCKSNTFCRRFFKIRMGDWSGKAAKKKVLRAISAKKIAQWVLIWSLQCSKKWDFEGRLLRVGFQKCASRSSGEHFFAKLWKRNASEQKI